MSKWKTLTARSEEEELGYDWFEVKYDSSKITEEQAFKDMEMAGKYASLHVWEDDLDNEDFIKEGIEEYDELFKEMAEYRCDTNGLDMFEYYLEYKGYKVKHIGEPEPDFTFEW